MYPLFIHEESEKTEISSMPGCFRHSSNSLIQEIEESVRYIQITIAAGLYALCCYY